MQPLQSFGNQGNVPGADLEETVATEGTTLTTQQVPRLDLGDGTKEIIRAIEDARVCFILRSF
jgi:hypothetical protein